MTPRSVGGSVVASEVAPSCLLIEDVLMSSVPFEMIAMGS
jgi:hypothetical protein